MVIMVMKDRSFWKSRLWRYASSGVGAISLSLCALAVAESDEEVGDVVRVGLPTKINRVDFCDTSLVDAVRVLKERWEVLREKRNKEWLEKQKEHAVAKPVLTTQQKREQPQ